MLPEDEKPRGQRSGQLDRIRQTEQHYNMTCIDTHINGVLPGGTETRRDIVERELPETDESVEEYVARMLRKYRLSGGSLSAQQLQNLKDKYRFTYKYSRQFNEVI